MHGLSRLYGECELLMRAREDALRRVLIVVAMAGLLICVVGLATSLAAVKLVGTAVVVACGALGRRITTARQRRLDASLIALQRDRTAASELRHGNARSRAYFGGWPICRRLRCVRFPRSRL